MGERFFDADAVLRMPQTTSDAPSRQRIGGSNTPETPRQGIIGAEAGLMGSIVDALQDRSLIQGMRELAEKNMQAHGGTIVHQIDIMPGARRLDAQRRAQMAPKNPQRPQR